MTIVTWIEIFCVTSLFELFDIVLSSCALTPWGYGRIINARELEGATNGKKNLAERMVGWFCVLVDVRGRAGIVR